MLATLQIKDFAIIDQVELSFDQGMTTLTGETGAGKSIIIDAISVLVGGRGSTDFIRTGAKKLSLQGLFDISSQQQALLETLAQYDIEPDGTTLLLEREISQSGRNVCRVNSKLVTTNSLRSIGEQLVDIHGQNEHQELMQAQRHLTLLDQFGSDVLATMKEAYQATYHHYVALKAKLDKKRANEQAFAQKMDLLQFQLHEIKAADINLGEDQALEEEHTQLANYQKITNTLAQVAQSIGEGDVNALDLLGAAMDQLATIEELNPMYSDLSRSVHTTYYDLQDEVRRVHDQLDQLEFDPQRLTFIEERLATLNDLKRKYGPELTDVVAFYHKIQTDYTAMQELDSQSEQGTAELEHLTQQLTAQGQKLTHERQKLARQLEQAVHEQLSALMMPKARFKVTMIPSLFQESGCDQVEFYLSANPGETLQPLVKVASGGELSRIMLALKTVFAKQEGITSIIFDEVDTGVSGQVAQAIAEKINMIAKYSQVLCISHLPQVAAMSDHQFFIEKLVSDNRTHTQVTLLPEAKRVMAIAKMLAGKEITHLTLEHAAELLREAHPDLANCYKVE